MGPAAFARVGLVVLIASAAIAAITVSKVAYPRFSEDRDEVAYVEQAHVILHGHLTLPARDARFFEPNMSGVRNGKVVLKYQPLWPVLLAASQVLFGTMRAALGVTAALTVLVVFLFARELGRPRSHAVLAAAVFACSPFVVLLSGTYLAYPFSLCLGLGFATLALRALRTRSRVVAALAGFVIGLALLHRPFDAILAGIPVAAYALLRLRREPRALLRVVSFAALGAAPVLVVTGVINWHLMGNPLRFPFGITSPFDRFGFGRRTTFGTHPKLVFTPADAAWTVLANARSLATMVFGGAAALALAAIGFVVHRRRADARLLLGMLLVVPVGYFFWWGTYNATGVFGLHRWLGPIYWFALLAPLTVLAADGLVWATRRLRMGPVGPAIALTALTLWGVLPVAERTSEAAQTVDRVEQQVRTITRPTRSTLVFLPQDRLGDPHPTMFNDGAPTTYALDRGIDDLELIDRRPDQDPYRVVRRLRPGDDLLHPTETLVRITTVRGSTLRLRLHVRNPGANPVVVAYVQAPGFYATKVLDLASSAGRTYDVDWTVAPPQPPRLDRIAVTQTKGSIAVGVGFGRTPLLDARGDLYEHRFAYRTIGFWAASELEVMLPAEEFHRWTFGKPTWVAEEIRHVVRADDPVVGVEPAPGVQPSLPARG
ncbi:MAG: hypothetical protein U0V73_15745 [Acidimicrobiia bacterium]